MTTSDIFAKQKKNLNNYPMTYTVTLGVIILFIGIFIGAFLIDEEILIGDYAVNLYTEVISIIVTVLILDRLNDNRRKSEQTKDLKSRLIRNASSMANDVAINAIEELRVNKWIVGDDGLLKGAFLKEANWENARLQNANLKKSYLRGANLKNAQLMNANLEEAFLDCAGLLDYTSLEGADLYNANLKNATLTQANLNNAKLLRANLENADLWDANMKGAFLIQTNLQNANLAHTNLEDAVLRNANLKAAFLGSAILRRVDFFEANLEGAYLHNANLESASLWSASLKGAYLHSAKLEHVIWERQHYGVILPDGVEATQEEIENIGRFIDSEHPEFQTTLEKINLIRQEMGIQLINPKTGQLIRKITTQKA